MDIVKDLIEAIGSRIRSHFFGSIVIAFIGFNWKPLFYLFFSDTTVPAKFIYFDGTTTLYSLFWCPFSTGILIALATPWVAWIGAKWAEKAVVLIKDIQATSASKTLERKYQLEIGRNDEKLKVIASTKAVEEAFEEIGDPDLRGNLKKRFEDQDDERDGVGPSPILVNLSSGLPLTAQSLLLNTPRRSERFIKINNPNNKKAENQQLVQTGLHSFIVNSLDAKQDLSISLGELTKKQLIIEQNVSDRPYQLFRVTDLGIDVGEYLLDLGKTSASSFKNAGNEMPSYLKSDDQLSSIPIGKPPVQNN